MRFSELATELGYKAAELLELARASAIRIEDARCNVDARTAAAVRAQVPHRSRLQASPLKEVYDRVVSEESAKGEAKAAGGESKNTVSSGRPPRPIQASSATAVDPLAADDSSVPNLLKYLTEMPSKIAVDTCTLMEESAIAVFTREIVPALRATPCKLIVPDRVVEELVTKGRSADARVSEAALRGLGILHFLREERLSDPSPSLSEEHADMELQTLVIRYRSRYSMNILTQEVALAVDLYALKAAKSVRSIKPIRVWQISNDTLCLMTESEAQIRRRRQEERQT